MTSTFQRNALDISYNGWENYETWNVALWINNDESLYHLAQECGDYETLVNRLYEDYGVRETKDGVKFADPKVNVIQINSDVFDFWPSLTLSNHTFINNIMRYIPMSQYTFEEICEQCRSAINRPVQYQQPKQTVSYVEVLQFFHQEDNALVAQ